MGEVIGESLPDEMMLLQSSESVLKDRLAGASLHRVEQLRQIRRLLSSDAQQMLGRIEEECLLRFASYSFSGLRHAFR